MTDRTLVERLDAVQNLIASKPLECLGIGQIADREWPVRDEVIHELRDVANALRAQASVQGGDDERWGQQYRCGCFLGFQTKRAIPASCPQHMRDKQGAALPLSNDAAQGAVASLEGEAMAWISNSPAYGRCYRFSNTFHELWPNAPVDWTPVLSGIDPSALLALADKWERRADKQRAQDDEGCKHHAAATAMCADELRTLAGKKDTTP